MKKLITVTAAILGISSVGSYAQGTTNILSGPATQLISFLSTGSNWMVAPYGIYTTSKDASGGFGIGAGYKINDFVIPTMRVDALYQNKSISVWMPSADLQLQAPITLFGKLTVIPFAFSGIATPLAGKGNNNGSVVGIFGAGAAVKLSTHFDLIGDYEKWTGFSGAQIRAGLVYKF